MNLYPFNQHAKKKKKILGLHLLKNSDFLISVTDLKDEQKSHIQRQRWKKNADIR